MHFAIQPPSLVGVSQAFSFALSLSAEDPATNGATFVWAYATVIDNATDIEIAQGYHRGARAGNPSRLLPETNGRSRGSRSKQTTAAQSVILFSGWSIQAIGVYLVRVDLYVAPHDKGMEAQQFVGSIYSNDIHVVSQSIAENLSESTMRPTMKSKTERHRADNYMQTLRRGAFAP